VAAAVASVAEVKRRVHPVEVEGDATVAALADPNRLGQALMHLVQNAIDASAPDVCVSLRYGRRGREAAIEVEDRGPGMSAEFIRTRLFQPFASTKQNGFGVGAFEAKGLVAAMGGRIEVESREGEGTRFTIFLPLAEAAAAPALERKTA
jgi:signal transduction histidine kinase